jgi:hypothetical protein
MLFDAATKALAWAELDCGSFGPERLRDDQILAIESEWSPIGAADAAPAASAMANCSLSRVGS